MHFQGFHGEESSWANLERFLYNVSAANIRMGDHSSGLIQALVLVMDYVSEALYPREFCEPINASSNIWFHYMLVDETCQYMYCKVYSSRLVLTLLDFHCFLALSASCVDFAIGTDEMSSPVTKRHYASAVRLVNKKLSGNQACADTAMAGVISLCILAGLREDNNQAKIHFEGLCRMIDMRGGMEALAYNFPLIEKIHR